MSIQSLRDSKDLRRSFEKFGRAGISQRIIDLVTEFYKGPQSYFGAIQLAGRLRALAQCAGADSYWNEKQGVGFRMELEWLNYNKADVINDQNGDTESVTFSRYIEEAAGEQR